jgi:hypothetical protein
MQFIELFIKLILKTRMDFQFQSRLKLPAGRKIAGWSKNIHKYIPEMYLMYVYFSLTFRKPYGIHYVY